MILAYSLARRSTGAVALTHIARVVPLVWLGLLLLPAPRVQAEPVVEPVAEPVAEPVPADPLMRIHEKSIELAGWLASPDGTRFGTDSVDALLRDVLELTPVEGSDLTQRGVLDELLAVRFSVLLAATPLPNGDRGEFLAPLVPGAMVADVLLGVPASITLAQAIIESGWGKSAPGYNLFGMKGEGPAGSTSRVGVEYRGGRRTHRTSTFRRYHSFTESIEDHARLLATANGYAAARAKQENPWAYARALQGTYASDPRYAAKLMQLSELYGLDRFNWSAPPHSALASNRATASGAP